MTPAAEQLKPQLMALSAADRADLIRFLIDTLEGEADADAEAAWDAELARREAEIRSGKVVGEPAGEVLARLREKYS